MPYTTHVLELLEAQHREIDHLFERLEREDGDRGRLFVELADMLAAHVFSEERILFPAVLDAENARMLQKAVEEHLLIKCMLADTLMLDPVRDRERFNAMLALLKEQFTHHAHDAEEMVMFPMLRQSLSEDECIALGREVLAMFEMMLGRQPVIDTSFRATLQVTARSSRNRRVSLQPD
jgi:hemerythrin superfamily protein